MTQGTMILDYLRLYKTITPMEAFLDCGITKLSTRIGELEREGWAFKREWVEHKSRTGRTVRYLKYSLK
jgi:hypothetical protein